MKTSYLTVGMTAPNFIRVLLRNKISWHPRYIARILFLMQSSLWSSAFSYFEEKRFRKKIEEAEIPVDPVFIIGHWRTGTTYLHQLLACDPGTVTPTLFQVAMPDSYMSSYRYYKHLLKRILIRQRPMDSVRIGLDEPQEDEYAIFRMTGFSPLEKAVFPSKKEYFLLDCPSFLPSDPELKDWGQQLIRFYKKLRLSSGKRIVSKNPFNSLRIRELARLFPECRFIHIYRHPFDVVPSTICMWEIVQKQNCLNKNHVRPAMDHVLSVYDNILHAIREQLADLPSSQYYEICFEDMEKNPVECLKSIYSALDIPFTQAFEQNARTFIASLNGYRKNEFTLTSEEKETIRTRLKSHMEYFGYSYEYK